ncbi:MAG TPA: helix-turn-helix domain-containing protein [Acidimicrobiia bacterium]|nr:helix-turn-helix domain-containing protein [Acidimicrobiia bacterium]
MESPHAVEEFRYRALADPTRRRILRILEDRAKPATVEELAAGLGLHTNTVRGHLDVLEKAALVVRSLEKRASPGRPRLLYSAGDDSDPGSGGYRFLAQMLTTSLEMGTDDPSAAAQEAGRTWGRKLTESGDSVDLSDEEIVRRITELLADLGFEPRPYGEGDSTTIDLAGCPFRDLARAQPDVVCSLHFGLLQGAVEGLGGTTTVESLQPFVAPSLCRTVLT